MVLASNVEWKLQAIIFDNLYTAKNNSTITVCPTHIIEVVHASHDPYTMPTH